MSIRVKSFLKDVGGAGRVTEARREKLKNASAVPDPKAPIRDLAGKLHPSEMQLRVTDIRDASPTAKRSASRPRTGTFRCSSAARS